MNAIAERKETAVETMPAASEAGSLMQVIERAARDPNVDTDKMRALLDMKKEIMQESAKRDFADAMNAAQEEMRPISQDASNTQTRSKYASYAALDRPMRPIYTRHGFSLGFDTADGAPEGHIRVVCEVAHKNGHSRVPHLDMPADGKGAKRGLLKMIFNIAESESDDDDGNAAGAGPKVSEAQLKELLALADDVGADKVKFCQYAGVASFADIGADKFEAAKKTLEAKRRAK
jgi:hypothetical protein